MSNANTNPNHQWKVIGNDDTSITYAATAGYGAIVKNLTVQTTGDAFVGLKNIPYSESMVYVPNVKLVQVKDGEIGTENEKEIWVLQPYFPGRNE